METINLTLKERISLMEVLPIEGSAIEQIIVVDIKENIRPKSVDIEKYNIKSEGNSITFDTNVDDTQAFSFNKPEMDLIKACCQRIDDTKKVTPFNLSLIRKILKI